MDAGINAAVGGKQQPTNGSSGHAADVGTTSAEEAEIRRAASDLPVSVVHLAEADEPNGSKRAPATLCGAPPVEPEDYTNVRYCPKCVRAASRAASEPEDSPAEEDSAEQVVHPSWCSPERCHLSRDDEVEDDPGIRVHESRCSTVWEDHTAQARIESRMFGGNGEGTYLETRIESTLFPGQSVYLVIPLATAAALRHHLDQHLQAAEEAGGPESGVGRWSPGHRVRQVRGDRPWQSCSGVMSTVG